MNGQPKPLPRTTEPSDAELLDRWRAGDLAAGDQLFSRYYGPLERFLVNKVATGIGDIIQDTFRALVEARDRIADSSKFRSYVFSTAYNKLRSYLRTRRRRGDPLDIDDLPLCALAPGPSSVVVNKREQRLLLEGLRAIAMSDQVLLELYYWQDMTTAEIADVLTVPRNTIKGQLQRARQRLETQLTRFAESPALLASTLSDLDDWARSCRAHLRPVDGSP